MPSAPSIEPPKNMKNDGSDIENANLTDGYEIELMRTIGEKLNFKPIYL